MNLIFFWKRKTSGNERVAAAAVVWNVGCRLCGVSFTVTTTICSSQLRILFWNFLSVREAVLAGVLKQAFIVVLYFQITELTVLAFVTARLSFFHSYLDVMILCGKS